MDNQWQEWIERLKSKDLTGEELLEFRQAVEGDETRRDEYLSALLAETALEAEGLPAPVVPSITEADFGWRWKRFAGIAAGIAVLASAAYVAGRRTASPPGDPSGAGSFFATVTDANGPAEETGLRIGAPLGREVIHLPDGAEIGIAMRGGARLELRGPAEMEIDGPDAVRLVSGRISTYAPSYAQGFIVDTVEGRVVDLGTRFVTAAGTGSGTEIHVLEGLVEAHLPAGTAPSHSLGEHHAAILRDGTVEPIDFLAQRLMVPLDPVLEDRDADGFPDIVEAHYGTSVSDPSSRPSALRIDEAFSGYPPGSLRGVPLSMPGGQEDDTWRGEGIFRAEGLRFSRDQKFLKVSGGSLRTIGDGYTGASFFPAPRELPPVGVTYISFLMRNPAENPQGSFAGLLLYQGDQEELFVGKLRPSNSYGSRLKMSKRQDSFGVPMDSQPHLFVIKIDRTRLITDVFMDPVPGQPESSASHRFRYQAVPDGDRIEVRSGSFDENFPSDFDEIRMGLTWDSVVPQAE